MKQESDIFTNSDSNGSSQSLISNEFKKKTQLVFVLSLQQS